MKKFICLMLCPLFLLISGCNKKSSDVTMVTTGLLFTAKLSLNGENYEYSVKITKDGNTEITSLKTNISYIFKGNNLTVKYGDLEYKTSLLSIPNGTFADLIHTVMKSAENQKVYLENDVYFVNVKTEKYDCTIFLGQSGLPIKLTENNTGITVQICNATLL